jgi:hypothetical protein
VTTFFTARTKSRQIFIDFQHVTMEIHEPKVTPKNAKTAKFGQISHF